MNPEEDSTRTEFWTTRIESGSMPWDRGGVPEDLRSYLAETPCVGKRVLIPGCGTAYEVRAFHNAGANVTGIDFCPAAVEMARDALGELRDAVVAGDFFEYGFEDRFDWVYERAFLCCLPIRLRVSWGDRIRRLLRPGGCLVGFFYCGPVEDGPPYGIHKEELSRLLGDGFRCAVDREVEDSVELYDGFERFQVWERLGEGGP